MTNIKTSPFGKKYIGSCYKRSYPTKREAKKAFKKVKFRIAMKNTYKCKDCGQWHLTHLTEKEYIQKKTNFKLIDFLKKDIKINLML